MSEDDPTDVAAPPAEDPNPPTQETPPRDENLELVGEIARAVDAAHKAGRRYLATRSLVLLNSLSGHQADRVIEAMKTFFEVELGKRDQIRAPLVSQLALNEFDADEREAGAALVKKLGESQDTETESRDEEKSDAAVEGADAT